MITQVGSKVKKQKQPRNLLLRASESPRYSYSLILTFLGLSVVCGFRMSLLSPIVILGLRVSPVRQNVLVLGCYFFQIKVFSQNLKIVLVYNTLCLSCLLVEYRALSSVQFVR